MAAVGGWEMPPAQFFSWRSGQEQWVSAQPPPGIRREMLERLDNSWEPREPKRESTLRVRSGEGCSCWMDPGSGAKARVTAKSEQPEESSTTFRVDSPDGKTFVTLRVKTAKRTGCIRIGWSFTQCEFTATDVTSGRSRMISDQSGEILFQWTVVPVINFILYPVRLLTYTDA